MHEISGRFWRFVDRGGANECWPWTGAKEKLGYGRFRVGGRSEYAHRVAYRLANGTIPSELVVRHKCDNPQCVNPNHLELGTQAENMADAISRQRIPHGDARSSKLTSKAVREILGTLTPAKVLAERYQVSVDYIFMIRRGERWAHMPADCVHPKHIAMRKASRRGELHQAAKLTEEDILNIRSDKRPQRVIAKDYGVHQVTISEIKRRKIWAHV